MSARLSTDTRGYGHAKVLLVGLDGASWRIIDPLLAEGRLPHLSSILERGGRGVLNSTIPPLTPPAWASLMTGMNPGKHGILTFRALDFTRYSSFVERLATSASFSHLSIFRLLSDAGARVASVGMPMTFPPFDVNGVLISGAPKLAIDPSSTVPPSLARELGEFREKPPRLGRKDEFRAYMARYLAAFSHAANQILQRERWDLFSVVYSNTDWVVHQFWEFYDETFPTYSAEGALRYGDAIAYEYEQADTALGQLLEATGDETLVILMSDHGAGANGYRAVALNLWLKEQGLLDTLEDADTSSRSSRAGVLEKVRLLTPTPLLTLARTYLPDRVKAAISAGRLNIGGIRFERTQAYRVPLMPMYDAVVLNLRGRQPEGIVEPRDAPELRARLKDALPAITDPESGEGVITGAWTRDELFAGPYLDDMPDVVVEYAEGYTGGAELAAPLVRPIDAFFLHRDSGFHRRDGILAAAGPGVDPAGFPAVADIIDVAPTVLAALRTPVPAEMDGRPISAIVGDKWTVADDADRRLERRAESIEDEEIRKSLEALGYF